MLLVLHHGAEVWGMVIVSFPPSFYNPDSDTLLAFQVSNFTPGLEILVPLEFHLTQHKRIKNLILDCFVSRN